MKGTAADLRGLGVIDEVLPEPLGGAHRDMEAMARTLSQSLARHLEEILTLAPEELLKKRYEKYRAIGRVLGG